MTYPVSCPNKATIIPIAVPTRIGTATAGTFVFLLVTAKIHKHKKPVPKASTNPAWNAFSTFPDRLEFGDGAIRKAQAPYIHRQLGKQYTTYLQ